MRIYQLIKISAKDHYLKSMIDQVESFITILRCKGLHQKQNL